MERIQFNKAFIIKKEKLDFNQDDEFGQLVQKTAKLIGRSFPATFKLVEAWEPGFVAALYDDCMTKWRSRGFKSPAMMWWTERKKKLGK